MSMEGGEGIYSSNPAVRIKARQERLEARIKEKKNKQDGEATTFSLRSNKEEARNMFDQRSKERIVESRKILEKVKAEGMESITSIRVEGDTLEMNHRLTEELQRDERMQTLELTKQQADEHNAAVALNWASLMEHKVPGKLMKALLEQKHQCDAIAADKHNLILTFTQELQKQDDEYVKELQRQAVAFDMLLANMEEQFSALQTSFSAELGDIEAVFEDELNQLHSSNKTEHSKLSEERSKKELQHMQDRQHLLEENQEELDTLQRNNDEHLNIATIQLQNSVQILKQQLEEMKATYNLNTQKLDYNISVLTRREQENGTMISQQKRKLAVLQDQVNSLKERYKLQDREYRQQNKKLTEEYKNITEQYKELQRKFRHFQLADAVKFREVWDMNEKIVAELIDKVLQADKVLKEQQLGLEWIPPPDDLFEFNRSSTEAEQDDRFGPSIQGLLAETPVDGFAVTSKVDAAVGKWDGPTPPTEEDRGVSFKREGMRAEAHRDVSDPPAAAAPSSEERPQSRISIGLTRKVFDMVANEAGFLVDDKAMKLLQSVNADEQELVRIEAILTALGVDSEKEEDVEKLLSYFFKAGNIGDDDTEEALIHPNDAVAAMRRFVTESNRERSNSRQSSKQSESAAGMKQRKQRSREEEKAYWVRLGNVLDDKTYRVWLALEQGLDKYHDVLLDRQRRIANNEALRVQNQELKALLNQYLRADVNDELYIPPQAAVPALADAMYDM